MSSDTEFDPYLVRLLSDIYGELSAQLLLQNCSQNIKGFLNHFGIEYLELILLPRPDHPVPETITQIWNESVIHANNPQSKWPAFRYYHFGELFPAICSPSSFQNSVRIFPSPRESVAVSTAELPYCHFSNQGPFLNLEKSIFIQPQFRGFHPIRFPQNFGTKCGSEVAPRSPNPRGITSSKLHRPSPHGRKATLNTTGGGLAKADFPLASACAPPRQSEQHITSDIAGSQLAVDQVKNLGGDSFGRGVIIKSLPEGISLMRICENIRGGQIERIDFREGEGRCVAGVYFVHEASAEAYYNYVKAKEGIYWGGKARSYVERIPESMGGGEKIKQNIQTAILQEGATRCMTVRNLPKSCSPHQVIYDICSQSRHIRPAIEFFQMTRTFPHNPESKQEALIHMGSVGTALGARLMLRRNKFYQGTIVDFNPDPCGGPLESLGEKWTAMNKYGRHSRRKCRNSPEPPQNSYDHERGQWSNGNLQLRQLEGLFGTYIPELNLE